MKHCIPLTDADERECIRKAQAGDRDAYGCIVEKYAGMLKGFCIRRLGCAFDGAEDIMQEAFCRAWKNISTFKHDSKFSTWLCTIARNHYLNTCSDRDNKTEEFDEAGHHAKGGLADTMATQDCVKRQLGKIGPEYRDVIDCVHLQDKSYKDAAQKLNWTQEQVRKRLHRALKEAGPLLRECL